MPLVKSAGKVAATIIVERLPALKRANPEGWQPVDTGRQAIRAYLESHGHLRVAVGLGEVGGNLHNEGCDSGPAGLRDKQVRLEPAWEGSFENWV